MTRVPKDESGEYMGCAGPETDLQSLVRQAPKIHAQLMAAPKIAKVRI